MEFRGFETADFDIELEDVQVKKVGKFQRVWSATDGGSIVRTTLVDGMLYYGSFDGYLYALDIEREKLVWQTKLGEMIDSSPVHSDGLLYLGGRDGNFYCVSATNGSVVWRYRMGGAMAGYAGVSEGVVYTSSRDSYFYAFDSKTGEIIWRFRTGDEMCCAPGFHDRNVIFGSFDGYAYCLDIKTGEEKWRFKTGAEIFCPVHLTINENVVFVPSFDSYLYALDTGTGKEIWRVKLGEYGVAISPTVYENRIYIGARDGNFYCLGMDGKVIWNFKTGKVIESKAVIHEGRIYFASEDNNFYCLGMDGREMWRFRTDGEIWDEAKIFQGKLIFGGTDCRVHFVDLSNGKELWNVQTSTLRKSVWQGPYEMFRVEVKKQGNFESIEEGKYNNRNEKTVSLSDYHVESEYSVESDYKGKNDYNINWVLMEELLWNSDLRISMSSFQNLR